MAGHPLDFDPLPSVNPSGAPSGFEQIHASPEMFGALTARATEGFGEGIEKLSNTGFQIAQQQREMEDKTRGAELHSQFSDQVTDASEQFLELKGAAALRAFPEHKQKIDDLLEQTVSQAPDPYTKQLVMQEARRTRDMQYQLAARHAAQQESSYQTNTAKLSEASYGSQAVLFASNGDLDSARERLFHVGQEARNQGQQLGYEGAPLDQMVAQTRGKYVDDIVKSIANKEGPGNGVMGAWRFYKSEENNIDAGSRTRIEAFLHSGLTQIVGQEKGEEHWRRAAGNLSSRVASVRSEAEAALESRGIPLNVTSGYRSPEHNAAVGGARGSQHLHGNAIDVSLTGLDSQQQRAVVNQFLSDPRVGGFGYYPRSNSIHVDVRQGTRSAWGTDYHGTSVGEGWPDWLTQQVRLWQGGQGSFQVQAPAAGAERVIPASVGGEPGAAVQPIVAAASRLPAAVAPTWQEKKAAALQGVMDDPDLRARPQQLSAAIADINRRAEVEHAQAIDETTAERAQKFAEKQASDAAELTVLQDIYSPAPKISATQMLDPKQMPALSEEARRRLLTHYPKPADIAHDTATYGPGFFDAYRAVHAPIGDPGRISDPDRLYEMVRPGGPLTVAGADKLISEIYKPKTPETEAETAMKKQFLENAKREVSGEHGFAKLKDPKGDEIFLKFLGGFFPAYEAGRKAGKSPGDLLDPNSKDYLGKPLETLKRPMSTWYQDILNDNPENASFPQGEGAATSSPGLFSRVNTALESWRGEPSGTVAPPVKPIQEMTFDELKAAVKAKQINRDEAVKRAYERGWIAPNRPPVPIEERPSVPVGR